MAAKGAISKEKITAKILETFEGAFINDKEIRIPCIEDGAEVQIKVTLTCAKINVCSGVNELHVEADMPSENSVSSETLVEPTLEEKQTVEKLVNVLF